MGLNETIPSIILKFQGLKELAHAASCGWASFGVNKPSTLHATNLGVSFGKIYALALA